MMKVDVKRDWLVENLSLVNAISSSNATNNADLKFVYFEISKDDINIFGMNYTNSIHINKKISDDDDTIKLYDGDDKFCINGDRLIGILKWTNDEYVTIESKPEKQIIVKLSNSKASINRREIISEFENIDLNLRSNNKIAFNSDDFLKYINLCKFNIEKDKKIKPNSMGILNLRLSNNGSSLVYCSTDGKRVTYCKSKMESNLTNNFKLLIPPGTVNVLSQAFDRKNISEKSEMSYNENKVVFSFLCNDAKYKVSSILSHGGFPNVDTMIQLMRKYVLSFNVKTKDLKDSVNRSVASSSEVLNTRACFFEIEKNVLYVNSKCDTIETTTKVDCEVISSEIDLPYKIGFDIRFLQQFLKKYNKEELVFNISSMEESFVADFDNDSFHLVAPLKQ